LSIRIGHLVQRGRSWQHFFFGRSAFFDPDFDDPTRPAYPD
jgi:hypothetical protein